jgi:hypothetical protein
MTSADAHSFALWLYSHGPAVPQLSITGSSSVTMYSKQRTILKLPFAALQWLQSLRIHKCQLHAARSVYCFHPWDGISHSSHVLLHYLTSLTALELDDVKYDYPGALAALAALTGLQQLRLTCIQQHR